MSTLAES